MYLAIAIVLFAIVFVCSSDQRYKKNEQYEAYKARRRPKTSREYYYAQFYLLEVLQKLIPVFQEYKQYACLRDPETGEPHPKAVEIVNRWKSEVLTVNHLEYKIDEIAAGKAREQVMAEGYLPSDPFVKEYSKTYDPWKFIDRRTYSLNEKWPEPAWIYISTYSRDDSDCQQDIRDLNEVAEKFGYHDFCDTVLHLHYNEETGFLYSDPAEEPCPCSQLKKKLFAGATKSEILQYEMDLRLKFGLWPYKIY